MSQKLLKIQHEIRRTQRAQAYAIQIAKETRQRGGDEYKEARQLVDLANQKLNELRAQEDAEKILSGW